MAVNLSITLLSIFFIYISYSYLQIQYIDTINVPFCILQQLLKLTATNLNENMKSTYHILPHSDKYPWCVLNNIIGSYYSGKWFYARFNSISWSLDWKGRPYSMACEVTWPEFPSLFLWEYLNSLVFETPVETDMELVTRIVAAYDIILNTSGIFVRVRQNLVCRCHVCIEVGGRQFEQLL